jgi:hypothetical protein
MFVPSTRFADCGSIFWSVETIEAPPDFQRNWVSGASGPHKSTNETSGFHRLHSAILVRVDQTTSNGARINPSAEAMAGASRLMSNLSSSFSQHANRSAIEPDTAKAGGLSSPHSWMIEPRVGAGSADPNAQQVTWRRALVFSMR